MLDEWNKIRERVESGPETGVWTEMLATVQVCLHADHNLAEAYNSLQESQCNLEYGDQRDLSILLVFFTPASMEASACRAFRLVGKLMPQLLLTFVCDELNLPYTTRMLFDRMCASLSTMLFESSSSGLVTRFIETIWGRFTPWLESNRDPLVRISHFVSNQSGNGQTFALNPFSPIPPKILIQKPALVATILENVGWTGLSFASLEGMEAGWTAQNAEILREIVTSLASGEDRFSLPSQITADRLMAGAYLGKLRRLVASFRDKSKYVLELDPDLNDVDEYLRLNKRYGGHFWGVISKHGRECLEVESEYFPTFESIKTHFERLHHSHLIGLVFSKLSRDTLTNTDSSVIQIISDSQKLHLVPEQLEHLEKPSLRALAGTSRKLFLDVTEYFNSPEFLDDEELINLMRDNRYFFRLLCWHCGVLVGDTIKALPRDDLKSNTRSYLDQLQLWEEHFPGICSGFAKTSGIPFSDFVNSHKEVAKIIISKSRWGTAQLLKQMSPDSWATAGLEYATKFHEAAAQMHQQFVLVKLHHASRFEEFQTKVSAALNELSLRHIYRYCRVSESSLDLSMLEELLKNQDLNYLNHLPVYVVVTARHCTTGALTPGPMNVFTKFRRTHKILVIEDDTGTQIVPKLRDVSNRHGKISILDLQSHANPNELFFGDRKYLSASEGTGMLSIADTDALRFSDILADQSSIVVSGCSAGQGRPHHESIARRIKYLNPASRVVAAKVPVQTIIPAVDSNGIVVGLLATSGGMQLSSEQVLFLT